ncbi:hypothetical protein MIND_00292400 [Mycena indigotica]|uniref:Uncharacterized protein n=1 Tax=Mycena indigotica TaxID=2126181 RepID=A0A8H6T823_9AGAR|nr:uncharacterized protein MIND_00292400 [Mycena indigotica]KAF7312773.1 hypothetical protein MIND_00292400 [Mycena indigotica]
MWVQDPFDALSVARIQQKQRVFTPFALPLPRIMLVWGEKWPCLTRREPGGGRWASEMGAGTPGDAVTFIIDSFLAIPPSAPHILTRAPRYADRAQSQFICACPSLLFALIIFELGFRATSTSTAAYLLPSDFRLPPLSLFASTLMCGNDDTLLSPKALSVFLCFDCCRADSLEFN